MAYDYNLGYALFARGRVLRNRVPVQGTRRPPLEKRSVLPEYCVKIVRGPNHDCNVVDSETGKIIYLGLDVALAQRLIPLTHKVQNLFRLMDTTLQRLKYYYDEDLRYRSQNGPDAEGKINGHPIERYIAGIHQKLRVQEARVEAHMRQLDKIWVANP